MYIANRADNYATPFCSTKRF